MLKWSSTVVVTTADSSLGVHPTALLTSACATHVADISVYAATKHLCMHGVYCIPTAAPSITCRLHTDQVVCRQDVHAVLARTQHQTHNLPHPAYCHACPSARTITECTPTPSCQGTSAQAWLAHCPVATGAWENCSNACSTITCISSNQSSVCLAGQMQRQLGHQPSAVVLAHQNSCLAEHPVHLAAAH